MQKKYKVKLLDGHKANPDQVINGCLGNVFNSGIVEYYTRGEAIKKASAFGGKIEAIESCIAFEPLRIAKMTRGSLVWDVEKLLNKVSPEFIDVNIDLNEKMYTADVFANIYDRAMCESRGIQQFEQLINAMQDFDYVLITNE